MVKNEKLIFFGEKFSELYQQGKRKGLYKDQKGFIALFPEGVSRATISNWKSGRSLPDNHNLERICDIFNIMPDYFEPQEHDDLYSHDIDFQEQFIEERLEMFCKRIGLKQSFITCLRELLGSNFDALFPAWSPIVNDHGQYVRYGTDALAKAAKSEQYSNYQIKVKSDDCEKCVTLTFADLLFLKDLQDEFTEATEFWFFKRSNQLQTEVDKANAAGIIRTDDGRVFNLRLDLFSIDEYRRRVREILRSY